MPEQRTDAFPNVERRLQTRPLPPLDDLNTFARLTRLYDIVRSLNSIIQLDKLLNQIVASAAEMMEARGGALMLVDAEGKNLTFEVASGGASDQLKGLVIPITERSVAGMVAGWDAGWGGPSPGLTRRMARCSNGLQ